MFQFTRMLGRALSRRVLGINMQSNIVGRFDDLLIADADYARRRNYEPVNGGPFRDAAAARWQEFVDANVRKVRNR
ncbi:MAG: hypothetical protein R6V85_06495 [Polyangia bacterium]